MCFYKILLAKLSELEYKNEYLHLRRLCANSNVVLKKKKLTIQLLELLLDSVAPFWNIYHGKASLSEAEFGL